MSKKLSRYTVHGIDVVVNPKVFSDVKTFRMMRDVYSIAPKTDDQDNQAKEIDPSKAFAIFDLMDRLLGDEQAEKVVDALADKDGFTNMDTFGAFLGELFEAVAPKN